eukprot:gene20057-22024_t
MPSLPRNRVLNRRSRSPRPRLSWGEQIYNFACSVLSTMCCSYNVTDVVPFKQADSHHSVTDNQSVGCVTKTGNARDSHECAKDAKEDNASLASSSISLRASSPEIRSLLSEEETKQQQRVPRSETRTPRLHPSSDVIDLKNIPGYERSRAVKQQSAPSCSRELNTCKVRCSTPFMKKIPRPSQNSLVQEISEESEIESLQEVAMQHDEDVGEDERRNNKGVLRDAMPEIDGASDVSISQPPVVIPGQPNNLNMHDQPTPGSSRKIEHDLVQSSSSHLPNTVPSSALVFPSLSQRPSIVQTETGSSKRKLSRKWNKAVDSILSEDVTKNRVFPWHKAALKVEDSGTLQKKEKKKKIKKSKKTEITKKAGKNVDVKSAWGEDGECSSLEDKHKNTSCKPTTDKRARKVRGLKSGKVAPQQDAQIARKDAAQKETTLRRSAMEKENPGFIEIVQVNENFQESERQIVTERERKATERHLVDMFTASNQRQGPRQSSIEASHQLIFVRPMNEGRQVRRFHLLTYVAVNL